MRRREFIILLGGAAASSPAWSRVACAQQGMQIIGFLGVSTSSAWTKSTAAFVRRLGELGWTQGRNVAIEYRWAEGRAERYLEIAAEFVRLKVDVIVTGARRTSSYAGHLDDSDRVRALGGPLGGGLVTDSPRPGGNVTGLSVLSSETASKRMEILREIIPNLRRMAVIGNGGYGGVRGRDA